MFEVYVGYICVAAFFVQFFPFVIIPALGFYEVLYIIGKLLIFQQVLYIFPQVIYFEFHSKEEESITVEIACLNASPLPGNFLQCAADV